MTSCLAAMKSLERLLWVWMQQVHQTWTADTALIYSWKPDLWLKDTGLLKPPLALLSLKRERCCILTLEGSKTDSTNHFIDKRYSYSTVYPALFVCHDENTIKSILLYLFKFKSRAPAPDTTLRREREGHLKYSYRYILIKVYLGITFWGGHLTFRIRFFKK